MADTPTPTRIGVVAETAPGERRVALVPTHVQQLVDRGLRVVCEPGAGAGAWYEDEEYERAGAELGDPWGADIVLTVSPPSPAEVDRLASGAVLVGFLAPATNTEGIAALRKAGVRAFAVEAVPRVFRAQSMDALSSQATVTGYRAALLAAERLPRFFPMLTTAAGTVPPASVLVLGAGVAGLQALATAKRLGARTTGYDVRPEVSDQVRSVGARWLDLEISAVGSGGYARELTPKERARQQERLAEAVADFDAVITPASVPGGRAPTLITELSVPGEEVVVHDVTICSPLNLPSECAVHASELYSRNLVELLGLMLDDEGRLLPTTSDEILASTCVTATDEEVD